MPGRARRWTIAVVAMAVGVLGVGALLPAHASTGDIDYVLTWNRSGVELQPDGSRVVTTDLGYTVTVTAGHLSTYSATLVSCPHGHGWFSWLFGMLGPGVAFAGHTSGGTDPALLGGPVVEDLTLLEDFELGAVTVHEPAYCVGHTNWGTLDPAAPTLVVEGTWVGPDGSSGGIDIETTLDWGVEGNLSDDTGDVHIEPGEQGRIEITRAIGTMFDEVDFATMDPAARALAVYRALADTTTFVVTAGSAHR